MKRALASAVSLGTAVVVIWLVSLELFLSHVATVAAIVADVSSNPALAAPVYLPSALISFHAFKYLIHAGGFGKSNQLIHRLI